MAEGSGSRCAAVDLAPLPWKSWGECLGGSHQVHGTCLIEDDCSVTLSKTARGKRDDARLCVDQDQSQSPSLTSIISHLIRRPWQRGPLEVAATHRQRRLPTLESFRATASSSKPIATSGLFKSPRIYHPCPNPTSVDPLALNPEPLPWQVRRPALFLEPFASV